MKLYFVRHAEAEDMASSDHARALTPRGIERTKTAGKVIQRLGIKPVQIFSSPRVRAKQTADIIATALNQEVVVTDAVNFSFDLQHLRDLVKDMKSNSQIMFVGHNPSMSEIVNELTGASVAMKKGALARVDVFSATSLRGELVWLIPPKVFDALGSTDAESLS